MKASESMMSIAKSTEFKNSRTNNKFIGKQIIHKCAVIAQLGER